MRRFGIFCCGAAALVIFAGVTTQAQVGGGKGGKGGFGRFGGFGGGFGGKDDPLALLRRGDVKKELDLSEEQLEKLPAAVMKAIGTVLNDKQMKRFTQLELQVRGMTAFKDEKVRKQLMISDSQVKNIDQILEDARKERAEIMKDAKENKSFKGLQEKFEGITKETKEKVLGVLNADQKKAYKQLIGEEFKFEERKGGFGKKKPDA